MDTYLSAARDLVVEGMRESRVALSADLEYHLASTLARYMHRPLAPDRLTVRLMDEEAWNNWFLFNLNRIEDEIDRSNENINAMKRRARIRY